MVTLAMASGKLLRISDDGVLEEVSVGHRRKLTTARALLAGGFTVEDFRAAWMYDNAIEDYKMQSLALTELPDDDWGHDES